MNPTFEQIYGKSTVDVIAAITLLGVGDRQTSDARLTVQRILNKLVERNRALLALGVKLKTYSADVSLENIDINTQRQTFTITLDMAISVDLVENESGISS